MYNSKIIGLGKYLPKNVVTNNDLSNSIDTSNQWIIERTGIEERRHIVKGDGNSTALWELLRQKLQLKGRISQLMI